MSAAVTAGQDLPPGALELIRAGSPQPKTENPIVAVRPAAVAPVVVPPSSPPPTAGTPAAALEKAVRPAAKPKTKTDEAPELVALVQDTYRLPAKYLEALAAAGFQRKMKRLRPFTKQDIVATALADWLIKEGFLEESAR
jgi:hypothetical protein